MWIIKWDDVEFSSDDMLIEDLESIEKSTGEFWSTANPIRSISVAKAFLAVALLRSGKSEKEVVAALSTVTLKSLKHAFEWRVDSDDDEPQEEEQEEPDPSVPSPQSQPQTSPSSSHSESDAVGRRQSRAKKGSATSS